MSHTRHDRFLRFRREPYPPSSIRMADRRRTEPRADLDFAGTFARAGWHDPEKWKPVFRTDHANSMV
jgi:hypothetical protein